MRERWSGASAACGWTASSTRRPCRPGCRCVAKLLALWTAASVFIAAGMLALIGFQLSHGYTRLEPLLYAQGFVVEICRSC